MMGIILLTIGTIFFGIASYLDLRYTEFPDWVPYLAIALGLVTRAVFSIILHNPSLLTSSILIGAFFLFIGYIFYFTKQWGDGDAWLFAALGFLFPDPAGIRNSDIFLFEMIMNFFIISFLYVIAFSICLGILNRKIVVKHFIARVKENRNKLVLLFMLTLLGSALILYNLYALEPSLLLISYALALPFLSIAAMLFFYYSKIIDDVVLKKRILTKNLKEGDVLAGSKWRGLNKKEIAKLRKRKKYVWIKEGVRFAPVFPITMLVTLFYGSLVPLII